MKIYLKGMRTMTNDIINMTHQRLMWLKNRISKKQTSEPKHIDLQWVDIHLKEVLEGVVLGKGTMLRANDMWRKYD